MREIHLRFGGLALAGFQRSRCLPHVHVPVSLENAVSRPKTSTLNPTYSAFFLRGVPELRREAVEEEEDVDENFHFTLNV